MLYLYYIKKLLGLKDVEITNFEDNEGNMEIGREMPVKPHICPECCKSTTKVHDYREQRIKDIPAFAKKTVLVLHKRRYQCECGKCFYEKVDFLPRYRRMTNSFQLMSLAS